MRTTSANRAHRDTKSPSPSHPAESTNVPARSGVSSTSMHTASSFGSSWLGSSPSNKSPRRNGIKSPGRHLKSPSRDLARSAFDQDSPSRQMVIEFSQILLRSDQDFTSRLDRAAAEHAQEHQEQLSKAALEHERVRAGAELEQKRLAIEREIEQRKREDEQREKLERARQQKQKQEEEAREREIAAKKREAEAAQRAAEQQKQIQDAEDKIRAEKARQEEARKQKEQKEAADRKAREETAAAETTREQAQQTQQASLASATPALAPAAVPKAASAPVAVATDVENLHSKYLELHQRMKAFWKPFKQQCAQKDNPLKGPVGDLRREIRQAIGQVTTKRDVSKAVIGKLRDIFRKARDAGGPSLDIRPFIVSQALPPLSHESEAHYPAILLYAFICFEKFAIKQFDNEAAEEEGTIIGELGLITASLFVDKEFMWRGVSMIDLLLAKYHKACPILFGITGNMDTASGRARLGFSGNNSGTNTNYYHQRMSGLGAGYAAMSLRAVQTPAIPISEYWRALSSICNIPPQDLHSGHFMVLKGLLRDSGKKFYTFYGVHAKAVLRRACIDLPLRAPARTAEAAGLVRVLPDLWKSKGMVVIQ